MTNFALNIGCGERVFKEYPDGFVCINVDYRNINSADVVADAKNLPFCNAFFSYILASDIIEHFPIVDTPEVLSEWRRVLNIGGIIEFRMPNLRVICKEYINNNHDTRLTSWLLYGGQDYIGNFHYVGFDRDFFKSIISPMGFKELTYREVGNNFEVTYRKEPL